MTDTVTLTIPLLVLDEELPKFEHRTHMPDKYGPADTYVKIMQAMICEGSDPLFAMKHVRIEATMANCRELITQSDFQIHPVYGAERLAHPTNPNDRKVKSAYIRLAHAARKGLRKLEKAHA